MFYAGIDMLFSILFPILFLVVLGMILYTIIGNISTWNKNNHSPRLTVPATVVAKRTEVSRHHTDNTMAHTFTTYYVTFQVESGSFLLSLRMSKKLSSILISIGKTDDTSFIGWFCGAIRFFIFRSHFFCFLLTMPR